MRNLVIMPAMAQMCIRDSACRLHGHKVVPIYNLNRLPDRGRLIWLCNPNNPTGEVREKEEMCIRDRVGSGHKVYTRTVYTGNACSEVIPDF